MASGNKISHYRYNNCIQQQNRIPQRYNKNSSMDIHGLNVPNNSYASSVITLGEYSNVASSLLRFHQHHTSFASDITEEVNEECVPLHSTLNTDAVCNDSNNSRFKYSVPKQRNVQQYHNVYSGNYMTSFRTHNTTSNSTTTLSGSSLDGEVVFFHPSIPFNSESFTTSGSNSSVISFDVDNPGQNSDSGLDSASVVTTSSRSLSCDSLDSCLNVLSSLNNNYDDNNNESSDSNFPIETSHGNDESVATVCSCNITKSVCSTLGKRPECIGQEYSPLRRDFYYMNYMVTSERQILQDSEWDSSQEHVFNRDNFTPSQHLNDSCSVSSHTYESINSDSIKTNKDDNCLLPCELYNETYCQKNGTSVSIKSGQKNILLLSETAVTLDSDMTQFMDKPLCRSPVTGMSKIKKKTLSKKLKQVGKFLQSRTKKDICASSKRSKDARFKTLAIV